MGSQNLVDPGKRYLGSVAAAWQGSDIAVSGFLQFSVPIHLIVRHTSDKWAAEVETCRSIDSPMNGDVENESNRNELNRPTFRRVCNMPSHKLLSSQALVFR